MKLLAKLEKTKLLWCIIALCTFFFFLRFPSLIEPYWYGDEGIYEVIGIAMNHGELLYRDIWDNKPPLLYVVYALAQGDQSTVKLFSIIAGLLSIVAFFFLAKKLFTRSRTSLFITTLYVILLGTPILEGNVANAEDFLLFPIILAGLLIYNSTTISENKRPNKYFSHKLQPTNYKLLTAGLLLGVAFLFKIVAIFDFAAFLIFLNLLSLPDNISLQTKKHKHQLGILNRELWMKNVIPNSLSMIYGFVLPLAITLIYFSLNNAFIAFFQASFSGNVSYVGFQNSFLGIPQGFLLLKIISLVAICTIIVRKRKRFSKPVLFITLWFTFSLFNAYFSQRPYTHYVIVLLPSFCLFVGLLFIKKNPLKMATSVVVIITLLLLQAQFQFNFTKSYLYYQNAIGFLNGNESVQSYQSFFDQKVPRDYAIAAFIAKNTSAEDTIFIWGNNPQIYALSHKLPPGKYTVAYHITSNNALQETQQAINKTQAKYVIILKESEPLPFALPLYIMRYNISGATIYERNI